MDEQPVAKRASSTRVMIRRAAAAVIAVHLGIGLFIAGFTLLDSDFRNWWPSLAGLTWGEQALVRAVDSWWAVAMTLLASDLVAIWILLCSATDVAKGRRANTLLTLILLIAGTHAALVMGAAAVGTFNGTDATFVFDGWGEIAPWLVIDAIMAAPAVLVWVVTRFRVRDGHCAQCGYDLAGVTGRCPECGKSVRDPA